MKQFIQRPRCHGKRETMRRQVEELKASGFLELKVATKIEFDTYEADVGEDNWLRDRFLAEDPKWQAFDLVESIEDNQPTTNKGKVI